MSDFTRMVGFLMLCGISMTVWAALCGDLKLAWYFRVLIIAAGFAAGFALTELGIVLPE